VVEDSPAGIQAARSAGMSVVALTTTHPPEDLAADVRTSSLACIHLGRIEHHARGAHFLELLVLEE
jgi:beta-phosphoglucomutase-like phosphatase (HAD superfamily)